MMMRTYRARIALRLANLGRRFRWGQLDARVVGWPPVCTDVCAAVGFAGNRADVPAAVAHRRRLMWPVALPGADFSDLGSAAETGG